MIPKNYNPGKHPLIEFWQNQSVNPNIIHHRSITDRMIKLERYWKTQYEQIELIGAIRNYNYVMGFPPETFWGQYPHQFTQFFRKGVQKDPPFMKFLDEAKPRYNLFVALSASEYLLRRIFVV